MTRPGGLIIFSYPIDEYENGDLCEAHNRVLNVELVRSERGPYSPPQEEETTSWRQTACGLLAWLICKLLTANSSSKAGGKGPACWEGRVGLCPL